MSKILAAQISMIELSRLKIIEMELQQLIVSEIVTNILIVPSLNSLSAITRDSAVAT